MKNSKASLIYICTIATLATGCSGFEAVESSSVAGSVFKNQSVQSVDLQNSDAIGVGKEGEEGAEQCPVQARTPGLTALATAINSLSAEADRDDGASSADNCEAGLKKFAARAVDANGATVAAKDVTSAFIGVYCDQRNAPGKIALHVQSFKSNGIRGNGIAETYLCKYGSAADNCSPASADFIGGLKYGSSGSTMRVSSVSATYTAASLNLSNLNTPALNLLPLTLSNQIKDAASRSLTAATSQPKGSDQLVSEIIAGGQRYSDLDECTVVNLYSPIVIERQAGEGVTTGDPMKTNTWFDLTGEGKLERLSCVSGGAFLALPDASGRIQNINQLFGDNTVGPDGQKAANGYAALAKHDRKSGGRGYGSITADDAVFSRLRLWEDKNCNGVAEGYELATLRDWNITSVRWLGAARMNQIDSYGNATLLRSDAKRHGQRPLRSFDIWFKDYSAH